MRTTTTLKPGQPGSKRFLERYGERLVCVRYRHDAAGRRRVTTVELIVDERPAPPAPGTIVGVRVRLDEPVLRQRVKSAGGVWNGRRRLWELSWSAVEALSLESRVEAYDGLG